MSGIVAIAAKYAGMAEHYRRVLKQQGRDCRNSRALVAVKAEMCADFARELQEIIENGAGATGNTVVADEQHAVAVDPSSRAVD